MPHYDWIDRWKGLLIILVVAGHVVGGAAHLCTGTNSAVCSYFYKVIYMFHMPAFFFLAGLCWRSPSPSSPRLRPSININFAFDFILRLTLTSPSFFLRKFRRLLIPYFVFGLFSIVAFLVMTQGGNLFAAAKSGYYAEKGATDLWQPFLALLHGGGWPHGEGFRCNSVLWFLPAMFSALCFYWILDHLLSRRLPQLVIAVALIVFAFYHGRCGFGGLPFGLSFIPWYGGFLILGRQLPLVSREVVDSKRIRLVTAIGLVGYLLVAAILPNAYIAHCRMTWYLVFFVLALAGIALSAQLAKLLPFKFLASCGSASLGIMLMHKFVVLLLQVKIPFVVRFGETSTALFWLSNVVVLVTSVLASYWATRLVRRLAPWALGE